MNEPITPERLDEIEELARENYAYSFPNADIIDLCAALREARTLLEDVVDSHNTNLYILDDLANRIEKFLGGDR